MSESKSPSDRQRVGVLMGGSSPERAVSLRSGDALLQALRRRGHDPLAIDTADGRALAATLIDNRIGTAVLALHGAMGEDGIIQGMLEMLGIPYTGSFVGPSALCMNKTLAKRVFRDAGIPTPPWEELFLETTAALPELAIDPPWFVKPLNTGSSVGISRVADRAGLRAGLDNALREGGGRILVERAITGRELTLSVLDDQPLPLIEIRPEQEFYDYHAKYAAQKTQYLIPPPDLSARAIARAVEAGIAAGRAAGCRGLYRVDIMLDAEETPWILEINTIPGLTATSLAPKAAAAAGLSFDDLAERILGSASLESCSANS
ncbi:MAG: D-alanine--D-alanine ligase [Magnetococcales bacterium]|nr:D-alanine--D-alanine ligase [Magnetococcales bacterium]